MPPELHDRAARSRQALLARFPALEGRLVDDPALQPVMVDGRPVDVVIGGGGRLYRGDAREIAARQVASYLAEPFRAYRSAPVGENLNPGVGQRAVRFIIDECRRQGIQDGTLSARPDYAGGLLVVLGVGLGDHLASLIQGTRARHILLVEPYPELLHLSTRAIDWQAVLEDCDARGCRLSLITEALPEDIVGRIQAEIATGGRNFHLDGLFLFVHYPADNLITARNALPAIYDSSFLMLGFYEDERIMLKNTIANLGARARFIRDRVSANQRPEPAFIIAAGPSLDADLKDIRRSRPGAVVFSCGTALQSCLRNGIVPDFHVEFENLANIIQVLGHTGRLFDLSALTLIGSSTVDPGMPSLFGDVILYLRQMVFATRLIEPADSQMTRAYPTVANVALQLAIALGFRQFYLFGTDFGSRTADRKHAADTVYQEMAEFQDSDRAKSFDRTVPANFGGTALVDGLFELGCRMMGGLIEAARVTAFNCSDGAEIKGAIPKRARSLRLAPLPGGSAPVRQAILDALPAWEQQGFSDRIDLPSLRAAHQAYFADLAAVFARARRERPEVAEFWEWLQPLSDDTAYRSLAMLYAPPIKSAVRFLSFFLHRLPDPDVRHRLFAAVLDELEAIGDFMRTDSLALFETTLGPSAR